MFVFLIGKGIRKMDNITYYLVKFAGRAVKEIKSSEEMRSNWPIKTIEFLQNKIKWVDPASKLKKVQDTGNERNVLGKPTSILCELTNMKFTFSI